MLPTPRRLALVPVLAGAVLVLAACAPTTPAPSATPSPSGTPSSVASAGTPTVSATPTPLPTAKGAAQVFDGQCDNVFPGVDLNALVGVTLKPFTSFLAYGPSAAEPIFGGISCVWVDQAKKGIAEVTIDAIPVVGLQSKVSADSVKCLGNAKKTKGGSGVCAFNATVSGLWLSGIVNAKTGTTNTDAKAIVTALESAFSAAAASAAPVTVPSVKAGTWSHTPDCAALSTAADVNTLLKSPGLTAAEGPVDGDQAPDGEFAAVDASGIHACQWEQKGGKSPKAQVQGFSAVVVPGCAIREDVVKGTTSTQPLTIDGVADAFLTGGASGAPTINVFDGPNWLQLTPDDPKDSTKLYAVVASLVQGLNATATK